MAGIVTELDTSENGPRAADSVGERLRAVRTRIELAANAAGRDPSEVTLIGVTKTVTAARIAEALGAGLVDLGENRAQELLAKTVELGPCGARWHFLGQLQRNKVKSLAGHIALWHSVDRAELVESIAVHAPGARVLIQVNQGGEPTKAGCSPASAPGLVHRARGLGLDVCGLMTVPPAEKEPRSYFAELRSMAASLEVAELSMGMSGDFEAAIAEGATLVRIGHAIFGARISR